MRLKGRFFVHDNCKEEQYTKLQLIIKVKFFLKDITGVFYNKLTLIYLFFEEIFLIQTNKTKLYNFKNISLYVR